MRYLLYLKKVTHIPINKPVIIFALYFKDLEPVKSYSILINNLNPGWSLQHYKLNHFNFSFWICARDRCVNERYHQNDPFVRMLMNDHTSKSKEKLLSILSVFNPWPCLSHYRPITILLPPLGGRGALPQHDSLFLKKVRFTKASHTVLKPSVKLLHIAF